MLSRSWKNTVNGIGSHETRGGKQVVATATLRRHVFFVKSFTGFPATGAPANGEALLPLESGVR
jgi:hypothetical protein